MFSLLSLGSMDYYKSRPIENLKDNDNFEKAKTDSKNAIADLTEAIKIRPFDALYHLYRGTLHSKLGEHKEASEDFSSVIRYASEALKDRLLGQSFFDEDQLIFNLRGKEYI